MNGTFGIEREEIKTDLAAIVARAVLCYTGKPHFSGTNNWEIFKQHIGGDSVIFERFERAQPQPRTTFGGFGVGLWICRTIVEAHGGRIWVKTAPGTGSCFTFEIPRRPAVRDS